MSIEEPGPRRPKKAASPKGTPEPVEEPRSYPGAHLVEPEDFEAPDPPGHVVLNPDLPKPSMPLEQFLPDHLRAKVLRYANEPTACYNAPYEVAQLISDLVERLRDIARGTVDQAAE